MLLPVLVTENIGAFAEIVEESELGCVVKPVSSGEVARKVEWIFNHQEELRQNIVTYAAQNSPERIRDYMKMALNSGKEKPIQQSTLEHAVK